MNKFRFITPNLHGVLDYGAAMALIVLPFVLGLAEQSLVAHVVSVVAGVGLIAYSLLTDYALSAVSLFSFRIHLLLDMGAAIAFLILPFILGFSGIVLGYYLVMGAGVIVVVALSQTGAQITPNELVSD